MARKVHHKHSRIQDLKVRQFKKADLDKPVKEKVLQNGDSLILESANDSYYLEFQIKGNEYCTIDFDQTYEVEKYTRKKHDQQPQIDRLIFKVANSSNPNNSNSGKPEDDNVDVKDPDDEPFGG